VGLEPGATGNEDWRHRACATHCAAHKCSLGSKAAHQSRLEGRSSLINLKAYGDDADDVRRIVIQHFRPSSYRLGLGLDIGLVGCYLVFFCAQASSIWSSSSLEAAAAARLVDIFKRDQKCAPLINCAGKIELTSTMILFTGGESKSNMETHMTDQIKDFLSPKDVLRLPRVNSMRKLQLVKYCKRYGLNHTTRGRDLKMEESKELLTQYSSVCLEVLSFV
jgi:hypothetical protein